MADRIFDKGLIERATDRSIPPGMVYLTDSAGGLSALIPGGAPLVMISDSTYGTSPHGRLYYAMRALVRGLFWVVVNVLIGAWLVLCYLIGQGYL